MKFIISRAELVALIGKIQNVVPSKPAIPILANVLIEAIDDQLIVSATDLMVSMRVYAPAKVQEEGSIALPAKKFFQLVRELTAPQVEIHTLSPKSQPSTQALPTSKSTACTKANSPLCQTSPKGRNFQLLRPLLKNCSQNPPSQRPVTIIAR